jgi:hypothetical protein
MLRAIADIGTDATTDLVSQIRLHQAALAVLDEARQDARIQQRAAIERAHGQQHAAPHVWQRGDLVLASHSARIARRRRQAQLAPRVLRRLVRDVARSRHRTSRSASHDSSADIERSRRATNPHARRHEHDHGSLVRRSQFPRRFATRQRAHGQSAAHRRRTTGAQTRRGTRHSLHPTPTHESRTRCRRSRSEPLSSVFSRSYRSIALRPASTARFKRSLNQINSLRNKLRRRLLRSSGESTRLQFRSSFPNRRSVHQLRLHVRHARRPLHRQAHALHVRAIGPARANGTSTPATQQARSSRSKASLTTVSSSTATST